jgi:hypothetical protein
VGSDAQVREEAEVDVPLAGMLQVMEAVPGVEREHAAQRSDSIGGIGVLEQELNGGGERERHRHRLGHTDEQQRGHAGQHLYRLVEGMLHEPVEAVEAGDAVVNGVESPQQADAVAGGVGEGDPQIHDQDGGDHLYGERPVAWPQIGDGQRAGGEGHDRDAGDGGELVDDSVRHVPGRVALRPVPAEFVGKDSLREERQGDDGRQRRDEPRAGSAAAEQGDAQAIRAEEHQRQIAPAHEGAQVRVGGGGGSVGSHEARMARGATVSLNEPAAELGCDGLERPR